MEFEIYKNGKFVVTEMTEAAARTIYAWKYPKQYKKYDFAGTEAELEQVMNGLHFPVYFEGEADKTKPCGFFAWGPAAKLKFGKIKEFFVYGRKDFVDVAMGLAPENCDKGLGKDFAECAAEFCQNEFPNEKIRLTVAKDNERAIKTYEKAGFVVIKKQFSYKKEKYCTMEYKPEYKPEE